MSVLVLGATGMTGSRVVARLLARGDAVRALARSPEKLPEAVEAIVGDVRDDDAVRRACDGARVVVSCLGTRSYYGRNGLREVDLGGNARAARFAAEAGVQQFVLLSAFGIGRQALPLTVFSRVLGRYFDFKEQAEHAVRASGVPFTIARPHEFRKGAAIGGPRLNQTEPLTLMHRVHRDVLADVLVACVDEPRALGAVFELVEEREAVPLDGQLEALRRDGLMHLTRPRTPWW